MQDNSDILENQSAVREILLFIVHGIGFQMDQSKVDKPFGKQLKHYMSKTTVAPAA